MNTGGRFLAEPTRGSASPDGIPRNGTYFFTPSSSFTENLSC
jgi:hypothetical protein